MVTSTPMWTYAVDRCCFTAWSLRRTSEAVNQMRPTCRWPSGHAETVPHDVSVAAAYVRALRGCCPAAPDSLAWKIGPSDACLTIRPRPVIRATANNRLGTEVTSAAAKQRRGRSGRLRTQFSYFADHAAQGRSQGSIPSARRAQRTRITIPHTEEMDR